MSKLGMHVFASKINFDGHFSILLEWLKLKDRVISNWRRMCHEAGPIALIHQFSSTFPCGAQIIDYFNHGLSPPINQKQKTCLTSWGMNE